MLLCLLTPGCFSLADRGTLPLGNIELSKEEEEVHASATGTELLGLRMVIVHEIKALHKNERPSSVLLGRILFEVITAACCDPE